MTRDEKVRNNKGRWWVVTNDQSMGCGRGVAADSVRCTAVRKRVTCTVLRTVNDICYDRHDLSNDVQMSREMGVLNDDMKVVCGGNDIRHSSG